MQVAVLGAAGGIGQPLSLLLKMNPLVSQLALYDIANTPGVAADLSHCNTPAQVRLREAPWLRLPPRNGTRQLARSVARRSTRRAAPSFCLTTSPPPVFRSPATPALTSWRRR